MRKKKKFWKMGNYIPALNFNQQDSDGVENLEGSVNGYRYPPKSGIVISTILQWTHVIY